MNKCGFLAYLLFFNLTVQGQSLIGANVDDLSDRQILAIAEKGKAQGLTIENGEVLAINMGLSADEALKFKRRLVVLVNSDSIESESRKTKLIEDFEKIPNEKIIRKDNDLSRRPIVNLFGHNYFNVDLELFDKSNGAKAPRNYILGADDELTVSIFGISYLQQTFTVSESGILNLGPKFGQLKVTGMEFQNVHNLLRARFSKSFDLSKNTFDLSLSYGRNISVNLIGEVQNPGTYALSALNNVFHAIVAAGGPTEIGSLRNVQVYRDGNVIEVIDFYDFFTNPIETTLPFLQDGDFLIVPTVSNLVTTVGEFKRKMTFEMLPDETVSNLIRFSSGFSANAYSKKIQIIRNSDNQKEIIDVEIKDFSKLTLSNGDSLFASVKNGKLENLVTVEGALAQPGNYGFVQDMNLLDLINLAGGVVGLYRDKEITVSRLMTNGYYEMIRLDFSNEDALNFKLSLADNIFIGFKSLDAMDKTVSVFGVIKSPGNYTYSKGMTIEDAINRAGGLELFSDNKRVEVSRQIVKTNTKGYQEVSRSSYILTLDPLIKENWPNEYKKSDFLLEPYDQISIRKIKNFGNNQKVYVAGAIEFPGFYSIMGKNERVSDIISRAGGVSDDADLQNAQFYREEIGSVVFNLEKALFFKEYNLIVRDFDSIHIPIKSQLVSITGDGHLYFSEFGEIDLSIPHVQNIHSYSYIKEFAIGIDKNAKKKDIYVSYPNGKLDRTKKILFIWNKYPRVLPGGTIHVNKKPEKRNVIRDRKPLDWNQVVATLTSAAMGFGTVYALINRP